jgi:hemerythrin-like domain-containing protein
VDRMVDEHVPLRSLIQRMRQLAGRRDRPNNQALEELREINASLRALVLPHQQTEEQRIFPELADRLAAGIRYGQEPACMTKSQTLPGGLALW